MLPFLVGNCQILRLDGKFIVCERFDIILALGK